MTNRATPGQAPEDPLREIRRSVVAIGTLPDPPPLQLGQLFHDGRLVDFKVEGTGFIYGYRHWISRRAGPIRIRRLEPSTTGRSCGS